MRTESEHIWVKRNSLEKLIALANQSYHKETGGVFLGYWGEDGHDVVITEILGPGPNAVHENHGFIPDYIYQEELIAERYEASKYRDTYLGDWHTHPDVTQTRLSWLDRRTLAYIASFPEARNPVPLMGVWAGMPNNWVMTVWKGKQRLFGNHLFGAIVRPLTLVVW